MRFSCQNSLLQYFQQQLQYFQGTELTPNTPNYYQCSSYTAGWHHYLSHSYKNRFLATPKEQIAETSILMYRCCEFLLPVSFLFISDSLCLYFSPSPHLCYSLLSPTCSHVFSLACLSVISSISATPTQLLSSSITPLAGFLSEHVCVCVRDTVSQRKMEWDNVGLCFCCLLCFICFMGVLCLLWDERERGRKTQRHLKCGFLQEAFCGTQIVKLIWLMHCSLQVDVYTYIHKLISHLIFCLLCTSFNSHSSLLCWRIRQCLWFLVMISLLLKMWHTFLLHGH